MTWPQYKRCECVTTVRLSPLETELLSTLLMRYPAPTPTSDLIEAVYEDRDGGPVTARRCIFDLASSINRKLGRHIVCDRYGYRLAQHPSEMAA